MNVFWYALPEKGARDYRAVTRRSLPSAFHRNLPEISITNRHCSNMSKNAQAEYKAKARFLALLRRRRSSSEAQRRASHSSSVPVLRAKLKDAQADNSRSYFLSCTVRQLTKRLLILTCINDFCDRFLILRLQRYEKIPIPSKKISEFFLIDDAF
jgi:hypothetical protein